MDEFIAEKVDKFTNNSIYLLDFHKVGFQMLKNGDALLCKFSI